MVADSENEGVSNFFAEIVVKTLVPVANGSVDGSIDSAEVPEEVISDSRRESSGITKNREELAEFVEVIRDATAVVDGGREILKELSNSHNSLANTNGTTFFKVNNHILDIGY